MVILDTCALIELCKNAPRFSPRTLKQIEKKACILSVSFAEIACKIALGRLDIGTSARVLYEEMKQIAALDILDITAAMWLDSIELEWKDNRDPADRLIVAYASKSKLPIATTDDKIKRFYRKVVW